MAQVMVLHLIQQAEKLNYLEQLHLLELHADKQTSFTEK